ncbi:MAG TPA: hypothetical protein VKQ72_00530, partial [Aggregatilineales bacterium]|nr:hypothetical protein [Aggregatilineales bacterium]
MDDENPQRVPVYPFNPGPVRWGNLLPANSSIPAIAELLAALANDRGGTILLELGGFDSGAIVDRVREAALCIDPPLLLPQPIALDSLTLAVTVPPGLPHVFAVEGRYLVRDGLTIRTLSSRELRRLLLQRGELNFEEMVCPDATLDDLDWLAADAYAARFGAGVQAQALLEQRGC